MLMVPYQTASVMPMEEVEEGFGEEGIAWHGSVRMAQFLDQQINLLARDARQNTDNLYARIQTEYQSDTSPPPIEGNPPQAAGQKPTPKVEAATQLRGL